MKYLHFGGHLKKYICLRWLKLCLRQIKQYQFIKYLEMCVQALKHQFVNKKNQEHFETDMQTYTNSQVLVWMVK